MNPSVLAIVAVVLGGAAASLQASTNAKLANAVGSPVNAALVSFAVGTAVLAVVAFLMQARPDFATVRSAPWYLWIGGLYGAAFVVAATWGVPRLGVATTIILMVAGQLLLSLVLDHIGFMGMPKQPISWGRVGGVALVIAGVVMVRKF